jgi:hypothetical protein
MTDTSFLYSAVAAVNQDLFCLVWRLAGLWEKKTNEREEIPVGRNV